MLKRFQDWLDSRTSYRALLHMALDEKVPGGARWRYVFGSAVTVLILMQVATGITLEAYYSPSTTDAWASVNYIQTQVLLGSLLRGIHHWGASAIVVAVVLHLLQTLWAGAFRAPREMNWLAGFVLLQLILGLALTGYLLPWDQKGYWATQVATSIAGTVPLIGPKLQMFLQGGILLRQPHPHPLPRPARDAAAGGLVLRPRRPSGPVPQARRHPAGHARRGAGSQGRALLSPPAAL